MIISVCKNKSKLSSFLDYYNYYYGGYSQNPEASDTHEGLNTVAAVDAADGSEATEVTTPNEAAAAAEEVSGQPENSVAATTEVCFLVCYIKNLL